jgi:hypothetical protein
LPCKLFNMLMWQFDARIAQLVEHDLAKVGVAGSSPVSRSSSTYIGDRDNNNLPGWWNSVDTQDLKSCGHLLVRVQAPPLVHGLRLLHKVTFAWRVYALAHVAVVLCYFHSLHVHALPFIFPKKEKQTHVLTWQCLPATIKMHHLHDAKS